jgi:hypothetical protein
VLSGAPIRDHLGTINLRQTDAGTEVSWHVRTTMKIPGVDRMMLPVFRWFIDVLLKGAVMRVEDNQGHV